MSGGQTVAEGAGVAVQSGVGVSPDGVVGEQGLSHRAGHLNIRHIMTGILSYK